MVRSPLFAVAALALAGACEKSPTSSPDQPEDDFWADAPKPTKTDGKRELAYKPDGFGAYTMSADFQSGPGADVTMSGTMQLALAFTAGAAPNERDARLSKMSLDMNAAGEGMKMKLDGDSMVVEQGGDRQEIKRGEPGILDVAAMTDQPFTTAVVSADKVEMRSNQGHPMTAFGGDLLDTALVLFPDLPKGQVPIGHAWSVKRNVALGGLSARVDVVYEFQYTGDGACPSGAPSCSLLKFHAKSDKVTTQSQGTDVEVTYRFTGKVFLDTAKGRIDESRVKMHMNATVQKMKMPISGTFIVKPA